MAETALPASGGDAWSTIRRILIGFVAVIGVLLVGGFLTLAALNTTPGRGFLAQQFARIAPNSGLTIRVGRIDGSLWGRLTIHDLAVGDPQGVFLTSPLVDFDWRPSQFVRKRLIINSLTADEVRWLRRPKLRKTPRTGPILPDFDIHLGQLKLGHIVLDQPVVGRRHVASLDGRADIHAGRALVDAHAAVIDGGDRVDLKLDAAPDSDRFDVDATVRAPAGGVLATLAGSTKSFDLRLGGDGSWARWRGTVSATVGAASLADLRITGTDGRFALSGTAAPGLVIGGLAARLTAPRMTVNATAAFADRRIETALAAASPALRLAAKGGIDLGSSNFDNFVADAFFLRSDALLARTTARDMKLHLALGGALAQPDVDYVFSAERLSLSTTVLEKLRVAGRAHARAPLIIPASATVARVTGVGPFVGGLLTNVRIAGPVLARDLVLTSNALALRSDKVNGRAILRFDLRTGQYNVGILGKLPRYLIPGVGLVDVDADLRVVPSADRRNPRLTGSVVARVVRLDNGFFRSVLEGLPTLHATIDIPPGGNVYFSNARVTAPGLTLTGSGMSDRTGHYDITASGVSRRYGPVTSLHVTGPLARPDVVLRLGRPGQGIGLAGIEAKLTAASDGWSVTAAGRSDYGPVRLAGHIVSVASQPTVLDVASLDIGGVVARGVLRQSGAALAGTLAVKGSGLTGNLRFSPAGDVQRVDAAIDAANARLALGPPVTIAKGTLRGNAIFYTDAPAVAGKVEVVGLSRDNLDIDAGTFSGDYRAGQGSIAVTARGSKGVPFTANGLVALTPNRVSISGDGTIQRRPVKLAAPAELTPVAGGWRLAPATLVLPEGRFTLSGTFAADTALAARLDGVGLDILDLAYANLNLGGRASGTVDASFPANGGLPRAHANLRIAQFSRAESAAVSQPVDIAVTGAIDGNAAAARAVIQLKGVVIGRMQAQLRPIPGSTADPMLQRLIAAPLFAQARFNGPAGAIWPLAGISAFDVRGPVAIAADFGGHLGEPTIRGTLRADGAHLESTLLGTAIDNIKLDGRFSGPRLQFASFTGTAGKGGTVSGSGSIDLSADRGFPIDLKLQLANAEVLRRDDLRATATGPLAIKSDKSGGLISGDLKITKASFRIGRTAVEAVPDMPVTEVNAYLVRRDAPRRAKPTIWRLAINADADNKVQVTGMGLDSEWMSRIKLTGPTDTFSITGSADLIRGTYEFAGRRFDLTRGRLRFTGGYPADPVIDILASNSSEGLTANIQISGTAARPELSFSSTPALPEDEVLSRVLFGTSITNLSAPEALQLAGAVASLRGGTGTGKFDVLGVLRKGIGIDRLRILPGDTTARTSRPDQRRGTTVAAGKYIGNRVYVELASDAQGYTATQIEVRLTRALSILSQVATFGGTGVNLKLSKDY